MRRRVVVRDVRQVFAGHVDAVGKVVGAGGEHDRTSVERAPDAARRLRVHEKRSALVRHALVALDGDDGLVEHDVEVGRVGDAPIVAKRLDPRRLVVRAHERHPADLHELGRGEEHHLGRIVQQRIDERPFLEDEIAEPRSARRDGRREPGGTGADDDDVTKIHKSRS